MKLRVGLGLRPELWDWILEHASELDAVELIVDDVLHLAPARAAQHLAPVREAGLDIVVHGVDLSLASVDGPDREYVDKVARLLDALGVETYSEHCSYHRFGGAAVGQFMPVPFTEAWAERVASNVRQVQQAIGRPMLIENIAYLLEQPRQGLGEAGFFRAVCEAADCGLLLDLENVAVNGANLGYDPLDFLAGIPLTRVRQLHLAGGHTTAEGIVVDSHSAPVRSDVIELVRAVAPHVAPECVAVVERDKDYPDRWAPLGRELADIRAAAEQGKDETLTGHLPLTGGHDNGADAIAAEDLQRGWIAHYQMGSPPQSNAYIDGIRADFREAFRRILRTKRRDKLEPLLVGTWRCLGELEQRDRTLRNWFASEPRQDLSRAEEVAGFCATLADDRELPEALRALAEHEATLVELRAIPFKRWLHALFPRRRERPSRYSARAMDAVAEGSDLPQPLARTARVRYTRRSEGVWVEDL